MLKTIIRGSTPGQVMKRVENMKKRGWEPLFPKPKYDPGDSFLNYDDSFVMVMRHPTLERTGKKVWH